MSSDVLIRQINEQHEVQTYLSRFSYDHAVIGVTARLVAQRLNKQGWSEGSKLLRYRGESQKKTKFVNVHPLDQEPGAGKGQYAYYVDKLGGLYRWHSRMGALESVRLREMNPFDLKHLEILLGRHLSSAR